MPSPLSNVHDAAELERFFRLQRLDPHLLKRFRYLLYAESREPAPVLDELPSGARNELLLRFRFDWLRVVAQHSSQLDGSTKLALEAPDGARLESVIMRTATGRISLCVSSQVGCGMRCRFCATAQMGLVRDLSEAEILQQVVVANDLLRSEARRVRNVVFMGMGEPLHNEQAVAAALEKLISPAFFGLSPRRLMLSTVGVIDPMIRFAERFPLVGLAVSLHSVEQAQREQLIPLARRYPLVELQTALREANRRQRRPLMIEYLMLDGLNDGDDDARRLADFVTGMWVHVNLIPYNPIAKGPVDFRPSPRQRRNAFAAILRESGMLATIRYSQGGDISAACGQLVQQTPA